MLSISDNLHLFTFPDKPNLPEYCFPIPNYLKRIFQFFSLNPNRSLEPKQILFYCRHLAYLCNAGVAGYVKLQRQTRCRQENKRCYASSG